jgi:GNAT superfamily N-acetyltransferase
MQNEKQITGVFNLLSAESRRSLAANEPLVSAGRPQESGLARRTSPGGISRPALLEPVPKIGVFMSIELALQKFPKDIKLKDGVKCKTRPLRKDDEKAFHEFFLTIPGEERMFIKHRVNEPEVIRDWCRSIDLGRNLPLLALVDGQILGCATLHQQLGGWKRHIGRVSVLIHPKFRGRGLARSLVTEVLGLARQGGLEKIEAEFIGEQEGAMKVFALLGFSNLLRLESYVKDMQAVTHDYVLMGLDIKTDEEYAGVG